MSYPGWLPAVASGKREWGVDGADGFHSEYTVQLTLCSLVTKGMCYFITIIKETETTTAVAIKAEVNTPSI